MFPGGDKLLRWVRFNVEDTLVTGSVRQEIFVQTACVESKSSLGVYSRAMGTAVSNPGDTSLFISRFHIVIQESRIPICVLAMVLALE